jgi:hypothetical protein
MQFDWRAISGPGSNDSDGRRPGDADYYRSLRGGGDRGLARHLRAAE